MDRFSDGSFLIAMRWALLTMLLACVPANGSREQIADSVQVPSLESTARLSSLVARVDLRVLNSADQPVPDATIYIYRGNLQLETEERGPDGKMRWNSEARLQRTDREGWWRGKVVSPPGISYPSPVEVELTAYQIVPPDNRPIKGSSRVKLDFTLDSVQPVPKVLVRLAR